ncbi:hypothetical protein BC940DRAFT_306366 [Gongronella butleri]|nr:hypothetical protein BC940DRAFT_306366 [Gongronella butleri]
MTTPPARRRKLRRQRSADPEFLPLNDKDFIDTSPTLPTRRPILVAPDLGKHLTTTDTAPVSDWDFLPPMNAQDGQQQPSQHDKDANAIGKSTERPSATTVVNGLRRRRSSSGGRSHSNDDDNENNENNADEDVFTEDASSLTLDLLSFPMIPDTYLPRIVPPAPAQQHTQYSPSQFSPNSSIVSPLAPSPPPHLPFLRAFSSNSMPTHQTSTLPPLPILSTSTPVRQAEKEAISKELQAIEPFFMKDNTEAKDTNEPMEQSEATDPLDAFPDAPSLSLWPSFMSTSSLSSIASLPSLSNVSVISDLMWGTRDVSDDASEDDTSGKLAISSSPPRSASTAAPSRRFPRLHHAFPPMPSTTHTPDELVAMDSWCARMLTRAKRFIRGFTANNHEKRARLWHIADNPRQEPPLLPTEQPTDALKWTSTRINAADLANAAPIGLSDDVHATRPDDWHVTGAARRMSESTASSSAMSVVSDTSSSSTRRRRRQLRRQDHTAPSLPMYDATDSRRRVIRRRPQHQRFTVYSSRSTSPAPSLSIMATDHILPPNSHASRLSTRRKLLGNKKRVNTITATEHTTA